MMNPKTGEILGVSSSPSFNNNTLEIKSGSKYKMYPVHELEELGSQLNDGLHFYLDEKFSIKVKNSANNLLLTLKIYNRGTGELIFMKSDYYIQLPYHSVLYLLMEVILEYLFFEIQVKLLLLKYHL